jgi:hypothetical protein
MTAHIPASVEAEKITAQGRLAFLAGKSLKSNPYSTSDPDNYLWKEGFLEEEREDIGGIPDDLDLTPYDASLEGDAYS